MSDWIGAVKRRQDQMQHPSEPPVSDEDALAQVIYEAIVEFLESELGLDVDYRSGLDRNINAWIDSTGRRPSAVGR